ncbi:LOG family protein [candidate division WWE3 bacterium]|jgi:uncharacterized protein (TIGR00730 family)|nr:LOG family protein [candidate division WWE3 bacterium]MBT7350219.1 LOG family protein [candidate division WWE3 bacterium]
MKEKISHLGHHGETEIHRIAFLGGASWPEDSQVYKDAYETAKLLGEHGFEIVNGGGPGVMRASTEGAHDGGAKVLAVTYRPAYKHKNYEGIDSDNNYDEGVMTLDYFDRTKVMLQNADVHIVFEGGTGTISEFGMTWASSRIHEGHGKPILLFGKFWEHIIEEFKEHMLMRSGEIELLTIVSSPQEVLDIVLGLQKEREQIK